MGKTQKVVKKNGTQAKVPAKGIQESKIKKNKQPKAKETPAGKMAMINNKLNGNGVQKKQMQTGIAISKPQKNQKKPKSPIKKEESDSEMSDIDEGVVSVKEEVSINQSSDEEDTEDENETPDIFGQSLADDSDEDDDDFDDDDDDEDEDDDEEEEETNKGIKAFKGIGLKLKAEPDDDDEDEEEDDDDDDDDDDSDDDDENSLGALMGDSLVDDDDDEDFDEEDEDDDDEEDDDDDDDDDSEDEEDTELNQSTASLPTTPNGKNVLSLEQKAKLDKRSIFIANIPLSVDENKIKTTFKKFGTIESVTFKGINGEYEKTTGAMKALKKKFQHQVTVKCAFVVFDSEESAVKALALNGTKLENNYLRVDHVACERKIDPKSAVFVGNIPFNASDNEIWTVFNKCGKVSWVRTLRNRFTGACRGSAFVTFEKPDSIAKALALKNVKIGSRVIRINRIESSPKKVEVGKKRARSNDKAGSPTKKSKTNIQETEKNNKTKNTQEMKQKSPNAGGKPQASPKAKNNSPVSKTADKKNVKNGNKKVEKKPQAAGKMTTKPKKQVK